MPENQDPGPSQDLEVGRRAAVYIDGFNLYHPVREMGENWLKWCNLWRLSELICESNGTILKKVVFCTALPYHKMDSLGRHRTFNNAQVAHGVTLIQGHYIFDEDLGRHTEKQSDINVALSLVLDGVDDIYDWAFLVSADSDQAATARVFKERLPLKKLAVVAPPNRRPPEKCMPYADLYFAMRKEHIERSLLPAYVRGLDNKFFRRPPAYDPPDGWLPPGERPRRRRG